VVSYQVDISIDTDILIISNIKCGTSLIQCLQQVVCRWCFVPAARHERHICLEVTGVCDVERNVLFRTELHEELSSDGQVAL
jgi:hypothetical protein